MKNILYIAALMMYSCSLFSQASNNFTNDFVLPPPEATSFMKFIDQPVDHFSGTTSIGIPIYTVNEGSLSLPINLAYHTGGVKVEEVASWVGMNWNISTGGNLSRTVRGLPDDITNGLYTGYEVSGDSITSNGLYPYYNLIAQNRFDTEADIFTFSAGGYSGKFYFDHNGEAVMMKGQSVKVEKFRVNQSVQWNKFIITTPEGNKYFFGNYDNRSAFELQWTTSNIDEDIILGGQKSYSVYHLLGIENYTGNQKIELFYSIENYKYQQKKNCIRELSNFFNLCGTTSEETVSCNQNGDDYFVQHIQGHRLNQISCNSEIVTFVANTVRNDLDLGYQEQTGTRAKALDKIQITGNRSTNFFFGYSYFDDPQEQGSHAKRLRLDSIYESRGSESLPAFKFEYFTDYFPNRLSKSKDHWGFYNGASNSGLNIPPTTLSTPYGNISYGNADREVNSSFVNHGLLEKITYPTGGTKTLVYENNEAFEQSLMKESKFYIKDCGEDISGEIVNVVCNNVNPSIDTFFTEDEIKSGEFNIQIKSVFPGLNNTNPSDYVLTATFSITDASNNTLIYSQPFELSIEASTNSIQEKNYTVAINDIPSGLESNTNYKLEVELTSSEDNWENGFSKIDFYYYPIENILIGGARVKKIITNDGIQEYTRSFTYNDPISQKSYGVLYQKPVYADFLSGNSSSWSFIKYRWRENMIFPYQSYEGNHIGYTKVIENTAEHGSVEYNFLALKNTNYEVPLIPVQGHPLHSKLKEVFTKDNNGLVVSKELTKYTPSLETNTGVMTAIETVVMEDCSGIDLGLGLNGTGGMQGVFPDQVVFIFETAYNPKVIKTAPKIIESTVDGVKTTQTFTYDPYGKHLFPLKIETKDEGGKNYTVNTSYLDAYPNSGSVGYFNANNMLLPAWSTIKSKNSNGQSITISGSKTTWGAVSGKIRPESFYSLNDDGTWKEMATISEYDANDFPKTIVKREKVHPIELTWKDQSHFGLLDEVKEHKRIIDYTYDGDRLLDALKDYNEIKSNFLYDDLGRLVYKDANNGRVKQYITYNYGLANGGENKISNTVSYIDGTEGLEVEKIFDGFGRDIEERRIQYTQSRGNFILSQKYNELGNVISSTDPGSGGTTTFDLEKSPLNRVQVTHPAGTDATIEHSYGTNSSEIGGYPSGTLFKSSVKDENGNISVSYTDIFGRQIATVQDEQGLHLMTVYTYNDRDQILTIQPPEGPAYVYTYFPDGLLQSKYVPDKGTTTYEYTTHDQIWKEHLPNGKTLEYVYNSEYNSFLEEVKLDGTVIKKIEPVDNTLKSDWIQKESQAIHFSGGIMQNAYTTEYDLHDPDFGRPEKINTTTLDGSSESILTYDDAGNVLTNSSTVTGPDGVPKLIYSENTFQKGFRSISALNTIDGINIGIDFMEYNENDWLTKNVLHKNIQTVDYSYNGRGWLTHINSVESTYNEGNPCEDIDVVPEEVDCEKLIDIVQSFMIYYDCLEISQGNPTQLRIIQTTQYIEEDGIASAVISEEIPISLLGATYDANMTLPNSISFNINDGLSSDDFTLGFVELLIDCINGNPQMLDAINQALNDAFGGDIFIGGGTGDNTSELTPVTNNNDIFGLEIHYEEGNGELAAPPQYNGNIAWMEWRVKTDQRHAYGFNYDGVNRLTKANYGEDDQFTKACKLERTDKYSVTLPEYDKLGNIKSLIRRGLQDPTAQFPEYGLIDQLTYDYTSNSSLLNTVTENSSWQRGYQGGGSTYTYDATGNLIADSEKGIANIVYSYNDLPLKITTDQGEINNWYTSDGMKVKTELVVLGTGQTDVIPYTRHYINGAEYKDTKLEAIYLGEGRITYSEDEGTYPEYLLKDHLGNTRARIADKNGDHLITVDPSDPEKDELMEYMHYYPFGMEWDVPKNDGNGNLTEESGVENRYTYNGKEFIDDLDIGLHDYGARYYDPAIGRWYSVDPLAEKMSEWSSYNYTYNNPIRFIDPDGRSPETCIGCGKGLQMIAKWALKNGYERTAGFFGTAAAAVDPWIAAENSLISFDQAGNGWEKAKALDPTGLTSLPETAYSAVVEGDKNAQGALLFSVVLGKTVAGKKGGIKRSELILDTNVVIADGKRLANSGQNVVKDAITSIEIKDVVNRGKIRGMPQAANQINSVPSSTNVNTRINVRGQLQSGAKGNFADGVIGGTSIERGSTLVTRDKKLMKAVKKLGGTATHPDKIK